MLDRNMLHENIRAVQKNSVAQKLVAINIRKLNTQQPKSIHQKFFANQQTAMTTQKDIVMRSSFHLI